MLNYYIISIKGKHVQRFIKQLIKDINIYNIKYLNKEVLIKVSYDDYVKLKQIKTSYNISVKKISGSKRIYNLYKKYKLSIIMFVISVFLCLFLSRFILFINIDTSNTKLKEIVKEELYKNKVTLFSFKKNYKRLNEITDIIKQNSNIEWIELDQKGVYLNVKVIERIKKEEKQDNNYKDIVASKNGYIKKIESSSGEILKNIGDYVEKDEIIVSGNIFKNNKIVGKTKAQAKVYAEVWYIAKTNKSLYYKDLIEQEKGRKKILVNVLNHNITLLSIPKKVDIEKNKIVFQNNIFKLSIKEEKIYKTENKKYNEGTLLKILETRSKNDISKKLDKNGYIQEQKVLKKYIKNDKMYIEVFFKTYENIAFEKDLQEIKEEDE